MDENKDKGLQEHSNFIFDTSSELHRAIAMSDLYYGDVRSSLVALYRATGKEIVFQDIDLPDNGFFEDYERRWPRIPVQFRDFAEDAKGNVYAFESAFDGLFQLDFNRNEAYYLTRSGNDTTRSGKRGFVLRYKVHRIYKNKLLCFPFWLEAIFVYDIESHQVSTIQLDSSHLNPKDADGFSIQKVFLFNDKFYCFGNTSDSIIVFDPNTLTFQYQREFFDYYGLSSDGIHFKQPYSLAEPDADGWMLMLIGDFKDNKELIRYNLESQKRELILENEKICGFNNAVFDGAFVWLFKNSEFELIRWDIKENSVNTYTLDVKGFVANKNNCFADMVDCGDYIFFSPAQASMAVKFCKSSEAFSCITELPMPADSEYKANRYTNIKSTDKAIYFFSVFDNVIYELSKKSGNIRSYPFTTEFFSPDDRNRFLGRSQAAKNMTELPGDAGDKIFAYVKNLVMKG